MRIKAKFAIILSAEETARALHLMQRGHGNKIEAVRTVDDHKEDAALIADFEEAHQNIKKAIAHIS